jgi:hypothetical protein
MRTLGELEDQQAAVGRLDSKVDAAIETQRDTLMMDIGRSLSPGLDSVTFYWKGRNLISESRGSRHEYQTFWRRGDLEFADGSVAKIARSIVGVETIGF